MDIGTNFFNKPFWQNEYADIYFTTMAAAAPTPIAMEKLNKLRWLFRKVYHDDVASFERSLLTSETFVTSETFDDTC